jgi:hypothetical protein
MCSVCDQGEIGHATVQKAIQAEYLTEKLKPKLSTLTLIRVCP